MYVVWFGSYSMKKVVWSSPIIKSMAAAERWVEARAKYQGNLIGNYEIREYEPGDPEYRDPRWGKVLKWYPADWKDHESHNEYGEVSP